MVLDSFCGNFGEAFTE